MQKDDEWELIKSIMTLVYFFNKIFYYPPKTHQQSYN